MFLFRNYGHWMFILYMCFIQQVKNIGTGTNLLALFCIPPFPHSVEDTLGRGWVIWASLINFWLNIPYPFNSSQWVTNINNFPTLCPLNFYLICVNIQFAIEYIHTPQVSSLPLKFVLTCKYRVSQKPPTGFVNVPLWGSTRVLPPEIWSSKWQLLCLPSQPKKMLV